MERMILMGIRLYFRNKYKPEKEYCLGKLFSYAEGKDKLKCVDFLNDVGALDEYWIDDEWRKDYHWCETPQELFQCMCECTRYIDYNEDFFELCTEDLIWFLVLYWEDHASFHGHEDWGIREEAKFIQENATCETRWEFRLGA